MPELKDIGGGFKQVTVGKESGPLEQAQQQLGLVDLINRIQAAPSERAAKDAEAILKQNEVKQIETSNALKEQQLQSARYDEQRKQIDFNNGALSNIRKAYQEGGQEMGDIVAKQYFGLNAISKQKENGAVAISIPGAEPISINPGDVTDPKEIQSMTQDRVAKWEKAKERYTEIYSSGEQIKKQLSLGTAAGDIASIYLRAKQLDPGGRVAQGDYDSVINSPNVPQYLKNQLTRAVKEEGPYFGALDSPTRRNFLNSSKVLVDQEKSVFLPRAEFFLKGQILSDKLDPRKIFSPAGDVTLENLGYDPAKKGIVEPTEAPGVTAAPGEAPRKPAAPKLSPEQEAQLKFQSTMQGYINGLKTPKKRTP